MKHISTILILLAALSIPASLLAQSSDTGTGADNGGKTWHGWSGGHFRRHHHGKMRLKFLQRKLNLTGDKVASIKANFTAIKQDTHNKIKTLRESDDFKALVAQIKEAKNSGNVENCKELRGKMREMMKSAVGDLKTQYQTAVEKELTSDQLTQFEELMAKIEARRAMMKEKWENMTPEQRQSMKDNFRNRHNSGNN